MSSPEQGRMKPFGGDGRDGDLLVYGYKRLPPGNYSFTNIRVLPYSILHLEGPQLGTTGDLIIERGGLMIARGRGKSIRWIRFVYWLKRLWHRSRRPR